MGTGARFVLNSEFHHIRQPGEPDSKYSWTPEHIENLVEYVATREGVVCNMNETSAYEPATQRQQEYIKELLETFETAQRRRYRNNKNFKPEKITENIHEYNDYKANPTKFTASNLISYLEEQVILHGDIDEAANRLEYVAMRPGVVKVGNHGLFSSTPNVDLQEAKKEIASHKGNIYTHVLSLRREDADRLGYDRQEPWRNLVMSKLDVIAKAHDQSVNNMHWYAGMHNTGCHPHIHLFVYFDEDADKKPFLSKKDIRNMKSEFAKEIFYDERHNIYQSKDLYRDELNQKSKELMRELLNDPLKYYDNKDLNDIINKMQELSTKLPSHSSKKFRYMPKNLKPLINEIQRDLVYKNEILSKLYQQYCDVQYNLEQFYVNNPEQAPIDRIKAFNPIKTEIIECAYKIRNQQIIIPNAENVTEKDFPIPDADLKATAEPGGPYVPSGNVSAPEIPLIETEYGDIPPADFETDIINQMYPENELEGLEPPPVNKDYYKNSDGNIDNIQPKDSEQYNSAGKDKSPYDRSNATKYRKHLNFNYLVKKFPDLLDKNMFGDSNYQQKSFQALDILANNSSSRTGEICRELADRYYYGNGCERDVNTAFMWYGIAADQYKDSYAEYRLGQFYYNGTDEIEVDANLAKYYSYNAYAHFIREIDNSDFFYSLQENKTENLYYKKAVSADDAYKEYLIGRLYLNGHGVEQDYTKALYSFSISAENGYAHANYYIGNIFYYGLGFEQSYKDAVSYYEKASNAGDKYADYRLGKMFLKGEGVDIDLNKAEKFFKSSSDKVVMANYDLAKLYENRREVFNKSDELIFLLYKNALEGLIEQEKDMHDTFTEIRIGNMYLNGQGTEVNVEKAIEWLNKAAEQNNPDALYQLGFVFSSDKYSVADEEKAYEYYARALEDYIKAEEENQNATAEYRIGRMYTKGIGTEINAAEGVRWLEKAALNNNAEAAYLLYKLYSEGTEIECNPERAMQFLEISCYLDNPYAQYAFAKIKLENENLEEGVKWLNSAAEKDMPYAHYKLGGIYSREEYGMIDEAKAQEHYSKALELFISSYNENADGFTAYQVGQMYLNGQGTEANVNSAVEWLEKSAEFNNPDALYQLGYIYSSDDFDMKDEEKAQQYFVRALSEYEKTEEENPSVSTEYRIGRMYLNGLGTDVNIDKVVELFTKAADSDHDGAAYQLYKIYSQGELPDLEKADFYLRKAAGLENPYAQYALGKQEFENGNLEEGVKWLNSAAEKDMPYAHYKLGSIYSREEYEMIDEAKAQEHYSKALELFISSYNENADGFTAYQVGQMYLNGQGTETNVNSAVEWLEKSAEFNNPDALYQLGYIYSSERYGLSDAQRSGEYFRAALNEYLKIYEQSPDAEAAYKIGTMYHYGLGVERDIQKAIEWYKKSVELGNQRAQQKLDEINNMKSSALMSIASTAAHLGRMIDTETHAAFKQRYMSDSKLLREEKIQKISTGQAPGDHGYDYDY